MPDQHEFEMALTKDEFLRLLPVAVGTTFQITGSRIAGADDRVTWTIELLPMAPRRIALLVLPRLCVTIKLDAGDALAYEAWLNRFMLGYQRAGG